MFMCLFRIPLLFNAGALMVLTLKVISCAMNYSDGLLKEEEGLRDAQKKYRLTKVPSLVEYFGYCLCCGSHFAGPVYEMKDYLEWTERKGVSSLHLLWVCYAIFF
jgi:lysophospholipid acyltransferase